MKATTKKTIFWILTGFSIAFALVNWFSFTSILLFATAILIAPIDSWQALLNGWFKTKFLKGGLAIILAILSVAVSPETETPETPIVDSPAIVQQEEIDEPDILLESDPVEVDAEIEDNENDITEEAVDDETTSDETEEIILPVDAEEEVLPENSTFEVHFIDVGQADAALVLCDGKAMLIDGGNVADSSLIYSYLSQRSISHLDYIIATHGHEDHVGGLAGALNYATVDTAYCSVTNYDSEAFGSFVTYLSKQGKSITVPSAGDTFNLGSAKVQILGPIYSSTEPNNTSIVLRIVYGNTSFLFTGDAEREEEQSILDAGYDLSSTVLKVGHHGSENSTTYPFLREIMPQYAVISVGEDNSYGHPTDAALSRLRDADVQVYRTDLQGTVICTSDGNSVSFSVQRNADADTLAPPAPEVLTPAPETTAPEESTPVVEETAPVGMDYVINTNTGKFHYPGCSSVKKMKDSNKSFYTGSRDDLVAQGYSPCGNCHP